MNDGHACPCITTRELRSFRPRLIRSIPKVVSTHVSYLPNYMYLISNMICFVDQTTIPVINCTEQEKETRARQFEIFCLRCGEVSVGRFHQDNWATSDRAERNIFRSRGTSFAISSSLCTFALYKNKIVRILE